jgi:tetratricopeptide (TPR) repeat protein
MRFPKLRFLVPLLVLPFDTRLVTRSQQAPEVAYCGAGNSEPYAPREDGRNRPCDPSGQRNYVRRHKGIGFDILDSESQACFVPDQEYRLLDDLIDAVMKKVKYEPASTSPGDQARAISGAISDALFDERFALYIDTETISDTLFDRTIQGQPPRRIFDCDTGSLIFLTVAENLGAPVALVEIPLAHSKNHHNYVRWLQGTSTLLGWDMNLHSQCVTPPGLKGLDGKTMSREEAIGLALSLRPNLWQRRKLYDRALDDFHDASHLYHGSDVYNNLAWLIATREVSNRNGLQDEALASARRAVALWPTANYKDTLACVYALRNDFASAIREENEAIDETGGAEYDRHLKLFQMNPPQNCTGQ